jgi:hypothetical protein
MPRFSFRRRNASPRLARGVFTLRRGVSALEAGDFDTAAREFRKVASSIHPGTSRLVRSVANFYAYNTERLRKEAEKANFGNANSMEFPQVASRDAWSDVDIAAVLVAPTNRFTAQFLSRSLGRSVEAVRFQRRYAFSRPLSSWTSETGDRYTRYTQTKLVSQKLGLN